MMIIFIDTEKFFEKIQLPFLIKTHRKLDGNLHNLTGRTYKSLQLIKYLIMKDQILSSKKSGTKQRWLISPFLFNTDCSFFPGNERTQRYKMHVDGKEKYNFLFINTVIYLENPMESTKMLLIINKFT